MAGPPTNRQAPLTAQHTIETDAWLPAILVLAKINKGGFGTRLYAGSYVQIINAL